MYVNIKRKQICNMIFLSNSRVRNSWEWTLVGLAETDAVSQNFAMSNNIDISNYFLTPHPPHPPIQPRDIERQLQCIYLLMLLTPWENIPMSVN